MAEVLIPEYCDICGEHTGVTWDVHMVLQHPETRRKPDPSIVKKKGTKNGRN